MGAYEGRIELIDESTAEHMLGRSWHDDPRCPPITELALLRLPHLGFDGQRRLGEMIVARAVADEVLWVFGRIDAAGYPIERMERVAAFDGDDNRSMQANNSSAFNFRVIDGTDQLSKHALGLAVDLNPIQNPWVRGDRILPEEGRAFLDRSLDHPAILRRPSPVIDAFEAIGWEWGGEWERVNDYHHFSVR